MDYVNQYQSNQNVYVKHIRLHSTESYERILSILFSFAVGCQKLDFFCYYKMHFVESNIIKEFLILKVNIDCTAPV